MGRPAYDKTMSFKGKSGAVPAEGVQDREAIAALNDRFTEEFEPPRGEAAWQWWLYATSGTTGNPIVSVVRGQFGAWSAQGFFTSARTLICVGTMGMRLSYARFSRRDAVETNAYLALDIKDLISGAGPVIGDFRPEKIVGTPSFMLKVAELLDKRTAGDVKHLCCVGEVMTADMARALVRRFPDASIRSAYGAVEYGPLSKPSCAYLPMNWYHPLPSVTVEVHEPDGTGVGDLLVSGMKNGIIPFRRYRVGDVGRLKKEFCPCGESAAFEVIGRRGYDYIKLAGSILRQEEFDRVSRLLGAWDDYRAEASSVIEGGKQKGRITIKAYRSGGRGTDAFEREVAERFSRELYLTPTQTLGDLVERGLFVPLRISYTDRPFPVYNKTVRLSLL